MILYALQSDDCDSEDMQLDGFTPVARDVDGYYLRSDAREWCHNDFCTQSNLLWYPNGT